MGENKVGKTTLSKALCDYLNRNTRYHCTVMSFADSVRHELISYYGIPADLVFDKLIDKNTYIINLGDHQYSTGMEDLWKEFGLLEPNQSFKTTKVSLRNLLINHATHVRRRQDPEYWVKEFQKHVDYLTESTDIDIVITDDIRYSNELLSCDGVVAWPIFWLDNGSKQPNDVSQDAANQLYLDNKYRCTVIKVPIPLSDEACDNIIVEQLLPTLNIRSKNG